MPRKKDNNKKWNELNQELLRTIKENDLHKMHSIYYEQALLIKDEGGDSFPFLEQSIKSGLYKEQNFEQLEILVTVDSCEECKSLSAKVFTVDEAIAQSPLPLASCSNDSCRCSYIPVWTEPPASDLE